MAEIPTDHMFVQVREYGAAAHDPTQKIAHQAEAAPSTLVSETEFNETCRVELDELSMRPTLQAPEQAARAQVFLCKHLCPPLLKAEAECKLCRPDHTPVTVNNEEKTIDSA
jgi:hypothetical protein